MGGLGVSIGRGRGLRRGWGGWGGNRLVALVGRARVAIEKVATGFVFVEQR